MTIVNAKLRYFRHKNVVFSSSKALMINCDRKLLDPDLYVFENSTFECELFPDGKRIKSLKMLNNNIPQKNLSPIKELLLKLRIVIDYFEKNYSLIAINKAIDILNKNGYKTDNLREIIKKNIAKSGLAILYDIVKKEVNNSGFIDKINQFFARHDSDWTLLKKEIFDVLKLSDDSGLAHTSKTNLIEFTEFSKNSSEIKIYLDESWPKDSDEGIIAGIVWDGSRIDTNLLKTRDTHTSTISYLQQDPIMLNKCQKAFPFILRSKEKDYKNLLTRSLKFLLGWLLPQEGYPCEVSVYMEAYTSKGNQFGPNTDWTDFFETIMYDAKNTNKNRYQRWKIKEARCVAKDFEYVAWGDLLAYFGLENTEEVRELIKTHKIDEWIGNVYIDSWLEQKLLEADSEKFNPESYIDLLINGENSKPIVNYLKKYFSKKIEQDENLASELINALDRYFSEKNKNVEFLEKVLNAIEANISNLAATAYARKRLKWLVFLIKDANHHGNIAKTQLLLADYNRTKKMVIENDRELVMQSDLAILVHFNDNFDFDTALMFAKDLINSPAFPYLSLFTRAKISSSYAQALSLNQKYSEAETFFNNAIDFLSRSDLSLNIKAREIHQTSIYRLTNAFDGNLQNRNKVFSETLGNMKDNYNKLALGEIDNIYDIHLLVKLAYFNEELRKYYSGVNETSYVFSRTSFHPWQFIYLYMALLTDSPQDKNRYLVKSMSICNQRNQGATMKFIGFIIKLISLIMFDKDLQPSLQEAMTMYATENIQQGEGILKKAIDIYNGNSDKKEKIVSILKLLPFNYH